MKITKFTHACVRVEHEGRTLVIDPGAWSEPGALLGADAVLVTHEHVDHIDTLRVAGIGAPIYAPVGAHLPALEQTRVVEVHSIQAGEEFSAGGFRVRAVGGRHAPVLDGSLSCANLGYIVEDALYHPGDSLDLPGQPIEVLCVPTQASWLRFGDAITFAQTVGAPRSFGIHEGQLNERGLSGVNQWLSEQVAGYRYLEPRQAL